MFSAAFGSAPETHVYVDHLEREIQTSVRNFADIGFIDTAVFYDECGLKTFVSASYDPTAGEFGTLGTRYLGYDANGNLTQGDGKSLGYTAFNKPATITAGGITATFDYGAWKCGNGVGKWGRTNFCFRRELCRNRFDPFIPR